MPGSDDLSLPCLARPPAAAPLAPHDIHFLLDKEVKAMCEPWLGNIPMEVYEMHYNESPDTELLFQPGKKKTVNIASYLGEGNMQLVKRLYFDPSKYPPMSGPDVSLGQKANGWEYLRRDLEMAANENGSAIISNGGLGKSNPTQWKRWFQCNCLRESRGKSKDEALAETNYRKSALINNRKENRKGGESMSKRVNTVLVQKKKTCKFRFTIKCDHVGFYVDLARNSGCGMHNDHPNESRPLPVPTRLLSEEQISDTQHVVAATCNKTAGRNLVFTKFGRFINNAKTAYLAGRDGRKESGKKSDVERMLDNFQDSNEVQFTCISDVPLEELTSEELDGIDFSQKKSKSKKVDSVCGGERGSHRQRHSH